jgi:hypothetical protein
MKKLNFGCGEDIKEGWDNIDIQSSKKIKKNISFTTALRLPQVFRITAIY